jgi:hypothetical protein
MAFPPPPSMPPWSGAASMGAPPRGPTPLRVCGGCGTIAPLHRQGCAVCNTPFGPATGMAAGGEGFAVWARVHESDFVCRGCGLRSPIPLGFGPEAECLRCGLRQAFPEGQWEKGVAAAHAVADLCGPDPEGRFPDSRAPVGAKNPHRTVGLEHTFLEHTESSTIIDGGGMRQLSLRVKASPGHPLCTRCRAPLNVQLDGRGNAQTVCGRCGERAVYALPAGAGEKAPRLRAVIGEEYRTDRPAAKIGAVDAAGVAAMTCPSCGAGLPVNRGDELATCAFCKTTSRIARRAWGRPSGEAPPFEPFWMLLEGPSPKRAALAAGRRGEDDDDDDDDDDEEVGAAIPSVEMTGPASRGWDTLTVRVVTGVVTVVAVFLIWGGYALYEYVTQNYEIDTGKAAKPAAPAKAKPKR